MSKSRVVDLGDGRALTVLEGDSYVDAANGQSLTGAWVWDASIVMAMWFTTKAWPQGSFQGKRVVELGAGTAVPGMALALLGANVVLTDRKPLLAGIESNIKENKLTQHARACELQWGLNPEQVRGVLRAFQDIEEQQQQQAKQGVEVGAAPEPLLENQQGQSGGLREGNDALSAPTAGAAGSEESAEGGHGTSASFGAKASSNPKCRPLDEIDFVIGSDIMFDPESETMSNLALSIKSLAGPKTRIFMCCELRPPLPECFRHLHDNGLRWKAVAQEDLHPDWSSEDIKIFEFFVGQSDDEG